MNGVRLFVDVANCGLVPDSDGMREKPTLLMLHGGPDRLPGHLRRFCRIGGPEVGAVAKVYWTNPTVEGRARYLQQCAPFYRHKRDRQPADFSRVIMRTEVALHFNGLRNEHGQSNFLPDLAELRCPVLIIAGMHNPIVPVELAEVTARAILGHLLRFERLGGCGHDIHGDDPERVFGTIGAFIAGQVAATTG